MNGQSSLRLLGPFGLFDSNGKRIEIHSKKSVAILAMLATAPNGVRSRGWLRAMLWGERSEMQASASLRKELSNLCRSLENQGAGHMIEREMQRVRLRIALLDVDIFSDKLGRDHQAQAVGQFLEGLEIAGAEAFEEWLRDERLRIEDLAAQLGALPAPEPVSASSGETAPVAIAATPMGADIHPHSTPPKPTVAVLPFELISGLGADHAWLGEVMADEIGLMLSQYPQIFVMAASSARRLARSEASPLVLAQQLGVRYLVEGTLGLAGRGERLHVSVKLIDGSTGEQIWGRSAQTSRDQVSILEEEIARQLAPMLWSRIDVSERDRVLRRVGPPIDTYETYWHASSLLRTWQPAAVAEATRLLDRLLLSTPTCPWANGLASFCCAVAAFLEVGEEPETLHRRALRYRHTALVRGPDNVEAMGYCAGAILLGNGDVALADQLVARALAIMPMFQPTLFWGGWVDLVQGDLRRAEERFESALQINPATGARAETLCGIGFCAIFRNEPERALRLFEDAASEGPTFPMHQAGRALAEALMGTAPSGRAAWRPQETQRFVNLIREPKLRALAQRAALGASSGTA